MLDQMKSKLYAAEAEEGMEMIQVAFSIAIAVMLAIVVMSLINNVVIPGMETVGDDATALFNEILADHELNDGAEFNSGINMGGTTEG